MNNLRINVSSVYQQSSANSSVVHVENPRGVFQCPGHSVSNCGFEEGILKTFSAFYKEYGTSHNYKTRKAINPKVHIHG